MEEYKDTNGLILENLIIVLADFQYLLVNEDKLDIAECVSKARDYIDDALKLYNEQSSAGLP